MQEFYEWVAVDRIHHHKSWRVSYEPLEQADIVEDSIKGYIYNGIETIHFGNLTNGVFKTSNPNVKASFNSKTNEIYAFYIKQPSDTNYIAICYLARNCTVNWLQEGF